MLKFAGIGIVAFLGLASFFSGADLGRSTAIARDPINVEQLMAQEAARASLKRGETHGRTTLVSVYARGRSISYEYELDIDPKRMNTVAAADELRRKIRGEVCKGRMGDLMRQGALLEYSYRTRRTKQFLFETRFNELTCAA